MDLTKPNLQTILDNNLKTKNKIRDILGESNNISRYPIAIHNAIALRYNEGWLEGYNERYYELTGVYPDITDGPEPIYEYGIDDSYYDPSYDTSVLVEIMKDCLNYRLGMKDELVIDTDEFVTYPDALLAKIDSAYDLGVAAGKDKADEDYEGDEDVDDPVVTNDRNKITITSEQDNVRMKYKFAEDGVEYEYTRPIIISEDTTLYVIGVLGRSNSGWTTHNLTYDPNGFAAFIDPPTIQQNESIIYLSSTLQNSTIEYKIDNNKCNIYTYPINVTNNDIYISARCSRNGEFSAIKVQPIKHEYNIQRPANVQCSIQEEGAVRRITLTCSSPNTYIWYSLNTSAVPDAYFKYNGSFTTESTRFTIYAYSQFIDSGVESSQRLYWKYDKYESEKPQRVNFIPNGKDLTLSCTTQGSVIIYKLGDYGYSVNSQGNYITIQPPNGTKIIAYAILNGVEGDISYYTFNISGVTIPHKPHAFKDENEIIHLISSYAGRYTIDGSDPAVGIPFMGNVEIKCTKTITLKAVAFNGTVASELYVATFYPGVDTVSPGTGGSGSSGGSGTGDTNFDESKDWFWMTGANKVVLTGSDKGKLQYWSGSEWTIVDENTEFNGKTYFRAVGLNNFNPTYNGNDIEIGGNINSLKEGKNYQLTSSSSFKNLFKNTYIAHAAQLSLTNIQVVSYESMFEGCTFLRSTPAILPAIQVGQAGYKSMFKSCIRLSTVPVLPATSISPNAYESMFEGCTSITSAPALNATTLASSCYAKMFKGCTSLVNPPTLPSITIAPSCYEEMFMNCISLEKAPELNAITLTNNSGCYNSMFNGCRSLNYIKAMFVNDPTRNAIYTLNWVLDVAPEGTFVKNVEATWSGFGPNAIPVGWSVNTGHTSGTVTITYNPYNGELIMKSSTGDPIYWVIDNRTLDKSLWTLYDDDNRPKITKPCTIYACCKNKDNVYSDESSYTISANDISYPKLTATALNGEVTISSLGFNYDMIQWGLCSGDNIQPTQWNQYTGKFILENDSWISMKGYINNVGPVRQDWQFIIPSLTAPTFGPANNTFQGNINISTYCLITWIGSSNYSNPELLISQNDESHYYSVGYMSTAGQTRNYTYQLSISWTTNEEDRIYYAKVRVTKNGVTVESSPVSKQFKRGKADEGSTVVPLTPGISPAGVNQWYITYPDENGVHQIYTEWNKDVPEIWYQIGSDDWKNYKISHPIDLSTMRNPPSFGGYVTLRVFSRTSPTNVCDPIFEQQVYYDPEAVIPTPGMPSFNLTRNFVNPTQPYYFTITNDYYSNYSIVHKYTFSDITYAGTAPSQSSFKLTDTIDSSTRVYIPAYIAEATVTVQTCIYMAGVGEKWGPEATYNFKNEYNPTNLDAPTYRFERDTIDSGAENTWRLYIIVNDEYINKYPGVDIHRYFTVNNPNWGPNSTPIEFNGTFCSEAGYRFATAGSGNFRGGDFTIWWEYDEATDWIDSVPSSVTTFHWDNPDIDTTFKKPVIQIIEDNSNYNNKLIITNPNAGYDTFWRIYNPHFAIDTFSDKYSTIKRWTWNYGVTLDEFLKDGTVQAWSADDEHTSADNLNWDLLSEQSFYFSNPITSVNPPKIEFTYTHGYHEILLSTDNKYATIYWQKENGQWHTGNIYGSSLGVDPDSCYCYAYSQLGNEKSSTVSAYFDNGKFTSYEAPTIWAEPNNTGDNSYILFIQNNSTIPNLKWMIDPTEWNYESDNNEYFTNYKKSNGNYLIVMSSNADYNKTTKTYSTRLNPNLASGIVKAFSTDATNDFNDDETSEITTYTFVNGNYNI